MAELARGMALGLARSLVIRMIAGCLVLPVFLALVLLPLALVTRGYIGSWGYFVFPLLYLLVLYGGGALWFRRVIGRRRQHLDAAFTPLGLLGSRYQMWFRRYYGTLDGRSIEVYFSRGPKLDIFVGTCLQTRMGITLASSSTRNFAALAGQQHLGYLPSAYNGLMVFAHEEPWARQLLLHPQAQAVLSRLAAPSNFFLRQDVLLIPGFVRLAYFGNRQLFQYAIAPAQACQWLGDALTVAALAESLPPPRMPLYETDAERLARSMRTGDVTSKWTKWAIIGLALFFLFAALIIAVSMLILSQRS